MNDYLVLSPRDITDAPDAIAPFSVQSYDTAKPFAKLMADAVEDGRMPPFSARVTDECKPKFPYANDPRLTEGLLGRGYSESDVRKILGDNLLRVFQGAVG